MKKKLINNWGYKLVSLIAAILLWLIIVNINDPTVTRTISGIPVRQTKESTLTDDGKVYSVLEGSTAAISVKGPRSLVDKLDAEDFEAIAPFDEITNNNTIPIYVNHKYSKYEKRVEIVQKTRTMKLSVEQIDTKTFDIVVNQIGEPMEGYTVGRVDLSKLKVDVTAPKSVLRKIVSASVDVDVNGLQGLMESEQVIKYLDAYGDKVELGEYGRTSDEIIVCSVKIYQVKEVPLTSAVTGTVADGYTFSKVEFSIPRVYITGENVALVDSIDLPKELLDIEGARESVAVDVNISQYLPEGISLYRAEDANVKVTAVVESKSSVSYMIPTANVELLNVPENLEAILEDSVVTLELTGVQSKHDEIDVNEISGTVDLTGAKAGSRQYEVSFILPEGMEQVEVARTRIVLEKK